MTIIVAKTVVIGIFRRDLRVADNPLLHALATQGDSKPDFFLPLYVFQANQYDVSGFIKDGSPNPYKPARSQLGGFYRCGRYRAEFVANAVSDLKQSLESIGSGLLVRVGLIPEAIQSLAKGLARSGYNVKAVWMTSHEGSEEKADERGVENLCSDMGAEFRLFQDEKYFIDDRDTGLEQDMKDLPDVFTTYRKNQEPLRKKPRAVLPAPAKGDLPPFPDSSAIPAQDRPFVIPDAAEGLVDAVVAPVRNFLPNMPPFPENAQSVHPFKGGETHAQARLRHLIQSGAISQYNVTRNGLMGSDFSTKLSAYLAQGCVTARQIHHGMAGFEDGTDPTFESVEGFGNGENLGTQSVRFELLWRDYMRLCHKKYGDKLFRLYGLRTKTEHKDGGDTSDGPIEGNSNVVADGSSNRTTNGKANGDANGIVSGTVNGTVNGIANGTANGNGHSAVEAPKKKMEWKSPVKEHASEDQKPDHKTIAEHLERFKAGTTGMGFIDASQRELIHTGYTSNRARQNVASFLAKHLCIDWRYGAEWYEMLLVDYDVSSNWANWQYVSGVGNDPRGELRIFNPVKQAFDYDKNGDYVRTWVPEVRKLERLENVFQACTASEKDREEAGLADNIMATNPIHKIKFDVDNKPRNPRNSHRGKRVARANRSREQASSVVDVPNGTGTSNHAAAGDASNNISRTRPLSGDGAIVNGTSGVLLQQAGGQQGYPHGYHGIGFGQSRGNYNGVGYHGGGRGGRYPSQGGRGGHGNRRGGYSGRGRGGHIGGVHSSQNAM